MTFLGQVMRSFARRSTARHELQRLGREDHYRRTRLRYLIEVINNELSCSRPRRTTKELVAEAERLTIERMDAEELERNYEL